jgi:hypothetical protein
MSSANGYLSGCEYNAGALLLSCAAVPGVEKAADGICQALSDSSSSLLLPKSAAKSPAAVAKAEAAALLSNAA